MNAISAAGIAYSVTKACSSGNLVECTCHSNYTQFTVGLEDAANPSPTNEEQQNQHHPGGGQKKQKNNFIKNLFNSRNLRRQLKKANTVKASGGDWKWGGCSDNVQFGLNKSKAFLDARIRSRRDIKTLVKTHNNIAGLLVSVFWIVDPVILFWLNYWLIILPLPPFRQLGAICNWGVAAMGCPAPVQCRRAGWWYLPSGKSVNGWRIATMAPPRWSPATTG